jgi:hypothetical protein
MKRLGLVLSLLMALGLSGWAWTAARAQSAVGPTNLIYCNKIAAASPVTATTTSLIAGVAGVSLNICGWHVTSNQSTSTTFQFEYGTQGGPCTSPTTFTPAFSVTSTAPSADRQQTAYVTVPAGSQVCVVTTGATVGQAIMIWYSTSP